MSRIKALLTSLMLSGLFAAVASAQPAYRPVLRTNPVLSRFEASADSTPSLAPSARPVDGSGYHGLGSMTGGPSGGLPDRN